MNNNQILLLNQGYMPLQPISWRKAVCLCIGREKAEVITEWRDTKSIAFNAAVVRLIGPSPDPFKIFQKQKFTKKNLFFRDRFECQYCMIKMTMSNGTIDHVIPKSQGGKNTYLNCVAACKKCNLKKDNRTPAQANMPLNKQLRHPNMYDKFNSITIPKEWRNFIKRIK